MYLFCSSPRQQKRYFQALFVRSIIFDGLRILKSLFLKTISPVFYFFNASASITGLSSNCIMSHFMGFISSSSFAKLIHKKSDIIFPEASFISRKLQTSLLLCEFLFQKIPVSTAH